MDPVLIKIPRAAAELIIEALDARATALAEAAQVLGTPATLARSLQMTATADALRAALKETP